MLQTYCECPGICRNLCYEIERKTWLCNPECGRARIDSQNGKDRLPTALGYVSQLEEYKFVERVVVKLPAVDTGTWFVV